VMAFGGPEREACRQAVRDFCSWPERDLGECPLLRQLLGVKQTRYAQSEFFRV
jgi:hypothetical protein